MVDNY